METFHQETVLRHAGMLANRVRKRMSVLEKGFRREGIEAFRLYDWDIPEVRAVVDWYAGHLVIGEYVREQHGPDYLPALAEAVGTALGVPPERRHLRRRRTGRPEDGPRYVPLGEGGEHMRVRERDLVFLVNLEDRLDTGLFPDHRETRRMIRDLARDRTFLNLYAYTGTFTCAAMAGGARASWTVDRSARYLDWARDNLRENGLMGPACRLERDDALSFLSRAASRGLRFDLIFVDPPSFSENPEGRFEVQRDHPDLLRRVLRVAMPGALVFFSTNHQRFEPRLRDLPARSVREITDRTVPRDYRNRQVHRCWQIEAM